MTRGTAYLILPKGKVISSCEFNGDMYGSPKDDERLQRVGYYSEMVERLKRVKDENTFKVQIKEFDKENFGYQDEEYDCEEDNYFKFFKDDWKKEWCNRNNKISFNENVYFKDFFSDYLYWLNLSGESVEFQCMNDKTRKVDHREIITFNFGNYIETIKK